MLKSRQISRKIPFKSAAYLNEKYSRSDCTRHVEESLPISCALNKKTAPLRCAAFMHAFPAV
jgi:hypothetical protein